MTTKLPYQPVQQNYSDLGLWCQQITRSVNAVLNGKLNCTLDSFTLIVDATSSTLTDSRIGNTSCIQLVPMTANAANTVTWISQQKIGEATISHAATDTTDRTFRIVIIA